MITQEMLTDLWNGIIDKVYCIIYSPNYNERTPKILSELERVGLLQTGKLEFIHAISSDLTCKIYERC